MRRALAAGMAMSAAAAFAAAGAASVPEPVAAQLIPETAAIQPGKTLWLDLHLAVARGWHTYWRNPGDSGLPTTIAWQLPVGFRAGDIEWPVPERFVQGAFGNYGYQGAADLLVPITAPASLPPSGSAHLAAKASWLVCSDICIPGEAQLALDLPVVPADATTVAANAALFDAARRLIPQPAPFTPPVSATSDRLQLLVPPAATAGLEHPAVAFYPYANNVIDAAAAPREENRAGGIELDLARASGPTATLPAHLAGVLALRGADGSTRAYTVSAPVGPALPEEVTEGDVGRWQALLLAFVGGIILNLMPCVFPVLSLKLLGLADSLHRADERRHAAAYAAGVIVSFAVLGGALLALRAGGAAIGWGFQLQSPVFVAVLAYLMLALGLSFSGVAEFGAGLAGIGGSLAGRGGFAGAFATGILATAVATPCSAPFMGSALGFALTAPAPLALAVFLALGAGLAAPLVLAAAIPGVARLLPRPGPWMLWFRQLLAFPLYGTVAWLVWVLLQEVAPRDAFLALAGLVVVGFAVWIYGRTRGGATGVRRIGGGFAMVGVAAALVLAALLTPAGSPVAGGARAHDGFAYRQFTTARLDRLVAEHRPVFVNLTAAWCITCLVNEATALDNAAVHDAFARAGIVALKGDWTRQDPEITAFLQKFGRSGVPLYLLYDKSGKPLLLPQLLTEASVLAAVNKI